MWKALLLLFLHNVNSMGLPKYIQACSRNDPNLNDCALNSAKHSLLQFAKGDKDRGMNPLDPIYVAEMVIYLPNEQGVKIVFKDNNFTGLADMQLNAIKFNLDKKVISVDALVSLDVKNIYELSGKFFMIPIASTGDGSIRLRNTTLHVKIWYEHVSKEDDKIHWHLLKHSIRYEVQRAYFRLENFMNDKYIGDKMNKIMNDMWRDLIASVGPTVSHSLGNAIVGNVAVLLEQVPYDELLPE